MNREMKDSGTSWAGTIPSDWGRIKFSQAIKRISTGLNPRDNFQLTVEDELFYVTIRNFKNGHIYLDENCDRISQEAWKLIQNRSGIKKGDVLFASISDEPNAYLIDIDVDNWNINESVFTIRCNTSFFNRKYFYYLITNKAYYDDLRMDATGSTFKSIKQNKLLLSQLIVPPLSEQHRIADFLDKKCSQIDEISKKIQEEINTLEEYKKSVITEAVTRGLDPNVEMKDSGIFYVGSINAKWNIVKMGYICTKLWRDFLPEDTALICSNKGKVVKRSEEMTGKNVSEDNAMQGVKKGDLTIHGMDTWHGAIAISDYDGKITRVVHVCDSAEEKRFISYYLRHLAFVNVYKLISNGIRENTSDFRSWEKVKEIFVPLPSIEEQKTISDYLDKVCAKIDDTVRIKQQQLSTLEEYKKSLIYEYVTGKKEVKVIV